MGARGWCDLLCLAACRVSTHTHYIYIYIYIECRGDGVDAVFKDHPPKGRPGRTARGKSLRPQPLARVRAREKARPGTLPAPKLLDECVDGVINPRPALALHQSM